jgi:hemolysin activation/secretion protein
MNPHHITATRLFTWLALSASTGALAQVTPPAAPASLPQGLEKSIEQSLQQSQPARLKPLAALDVLGLESNQSIDKLLGVQVEHPDYRDAVQRYWALRIGQPVDASALQDFRGWLFAESRLRGYLSYADTQVQASAGGSTLVVRVVEPKLQAVRVTSSSDDAMQRYGKLVVERLAQDFKTGQPVDTLGLDQRLVSASEDLPLELEATIRAVGPNEVDLIVQMRDLVHKAGRAKDSLVQLNNHGLRQYGRAQALASTVIEGLDPRSSLSLVGLKSQGITYGRAEYDAATYGSRRHWSVWASGSNSRNILGGAATTLGSSTEVGVGVSQIDGGWRDYVYRGRVELMTRRSSSKLELTGQEITKVHDTQYRMRISADNEKTTEASSRAEYLFVVGEYSRLDGISSVDTGPYGKVEFNLRHQRALDLQRQWVGSIKLRGQLSFSRLDSYNQMVLGGVNGVRAYTSVDGLGDNGGLLNLEINRRLSSGQSVGAFYDGGLIRLSSPQASEPQRRYSLQALGTQVSGQTLGGLYNVSLAKGIGGYAGWNAYNTETKPNNWRLNVAMTWFVQ